jgi:hypothetical protein
MRGPVSTQCIYIHKRQIVIVLDWGLVGLPLLIEERVKTLLAYSRYVEMNTCVGTGSTV